MMKQKCLQYVLLFFIMNSSTFLFGQMITKGKEYSIRWSPVTTIINGDTMVKYGSGDTIFYKYNIHAFDVVNEDTVLIDTVVYKCNHCYSDIKSHYPQLDVEFFQEEYLKCFDICRDSCPYYWPYYWLDNYSKLLSHDKTILVMEKVEDRGLFRINGCKIGGRYVDMKLDTGATNVVIPKKLADSLPKNALTKVGEALVKTANKYKKMDVAIIHDFEIGGVQFANVESCINDEEGASVLLGQSLLSRLFTYTIIDDRFIIEKDNPNYDLSKVKGLVSDINSFFTLEYFYVDNDEELRDECGKVVEKLLELERICELDALHMLYLATCYYEIGEYNKCIRTCSRFIYTYSNQKEDVFKRMFASIYSLQMKSMYYYNLDYAVIFPLLEKLQLLESYMDTAYLRSIKYFSAICNYCIGDYEASEFYLKQSIQGFQYCLSENYGYRMNDSPLLARMFYDFSLWSYEIGEKTHGDSFLRHSYCLNPNIGAREIMLKHTSLYTGSCWPYKSRLEVFDVYLQAIPSQVSTPLVGNGFCKLLIGDEESWQYYFYNKKSERIIFDD